jgi:hypothetical protein
MPDSTFTLRNIFDLPDSGVFDRAASSSAQIRDDIAKQYKDHNWSVEMPRVETKADALFDTDVANVLVSAWKKTGEIRSVLQDSKNSPGDIFYVDLAKHKIDSVHKPYVEMKVGNGAGTKVLELTVTLAMTIKSFQLRIERGEISEIHTGQCEAEGSVAFKGHEFIKKELASIKLPGIVDLRSGAPTSSTEGDDRGAKDGSH